jgi:signal transduction histidine kinase
MRIMDSIYTAPDGEIFKKAVSYTDKIELSHWQKNISFDFVGLHFLRPEDNLYSWKLENYDTKWSTPSKERRAAYTNLSPGTYTFRVKASNADGVWNEESTSLEIVVLPPWWQTWWAYLMYGLVLLFITHRFHLYQKQKTQRIEREKSQQKEIEQAKEIEKAYTDLKSAQAQLIQSEKMASLGELTAGIAHEIQNPLNFVNNFAEVSNELIDEMNEELEKGDLEEVKAISLDIKQNLEKINHHGKRADTIVKGMLEHSRTNSKEKTLTDLNALADEFLKLSYHGLRAKDKSFNSDYELDLDTNLQKTAVVAPDIGRVLLNLINNAFYAVNERAKTEEGFKPLVSVSTKQVGNKVEIKVADNGNGIPETIKDKIFQPFFTTKPTGSGTGLGLSLSYDIIKAHGGELLLKTKEGEGSIFVISLPND